MQLSFLSDCGSNSNTPGSGEHEVLDFSVGFSPRPSVSVCSLKGVGLHLYVQRLIFSLLSIHKAVLPQRYYAKILKREVKINSLFEITGRMSTGRTNY